MPQTNPFHSLVPGRKLTDEELARSIRLNLEAELDAINLYAAHIEATDNEDAKRIIRHVMNEEKEHAALFWQLIFRLDPKQQKEWDEAPAKFKLLLAGASDEEVERAGKGDEGDDDDDEAPAIQKTMTVGNLKR